MCYLKLLKELEPQIRAIAKKVSRKYSYLDEDDFYQEAVIYLWKMCEEDQISDKTDSYLLQGCYYFLKNYLRKVSKSVDNNSFSIYAAGEDNDISFIDTLPMPVYTVEADSVEIFLLCDSVESMFTDREKNIFYYKLEGYSTREIGQRIGVSHVMISKIERKMREKCLCIKKKIF